MTSRSFAGLPELLAEIAEVAGLEAALALAKAKGGQRVYIPAHPRVGNWLVEAVGLEAAEKICEHFRTYDPDGERHSEHSTAVVVPLGPERSLMKRALSELDKHLAAGLSARDAAQRAGLHERTAFRARRRMKDAAKSRVAEPDLFEGLAEPAKPAGRRAR